ncbi:HAD family hydrolase [Clostridium cellulovorans]|uniref:HAD-superfamily hydrolase, subfamily IA, variant 3 n=1 Tax=Clostridium cellulovorans (strain ATCC 35296 / DSM 3052 / OCM 3 / 743B) TaxID=573061 RepID=D9SS26_CLOC7|nr:HAD-IA family hydrolase [Clostridium cellulovorans]ADL52473.1 HAD-superfamily hydrolase, subfamily IA, variant 3 [Clostridium cellulovorans 743B]
MKNNIDVILFDLFFTLVTPRYNDFKNENDIIGMSVEEWEEHSEDSELYLKRATGKEINPQQIIENIVSKIGMQLSENEKLEMLNLREHRFKNSLTNIDNNILKVILELKNSGKKLCLISNADVIDVMHWESSPLGQIFDKAIFSYKVGFLKPQREIYEIALKKMNTTPDRCIFIGDGGFNELKGAKRLGIKTIMTSYLLKRTEEELNLFKDDVDYFINDFYEILEIVNR